MAITKVDIWNAFRMTRGYRRVPVAEAKALIGQSAMRYWTKKGWLSASRKGDVPYVELTDDGIHNLETGIQSHIENHPDDRAELRYFPQRLEVPLIHVEYV